MAYCFLCFESQPKHDLGNNCHFFQPSQASLNSLQCIFTLFVFLHLFVKFKHSIFHGHSIFLSMVKATFDCMKFNKVATFHCNWHPKRPNNRHPVIPILTWIWCLNPSFFWGGGQQKNTPPHLQVWRNEGKMDCPKLLSLPFETCSQPPPVAEPHVVAGVFGGFETAPMTAGPRRPYSLVVGSMFFLVPEVIISYKQAVIMSTEYSHNLNMLKREYEIGPLNWNS